MVLGRRLLPLGPIDQQEGEGNVFRGSTRLRTNPEAPSPGSGVAEPDAQIGGLANRRETTRVDLLSGLRLTHHN
jgi:hypothetical protein